MSDVGEIARVIGHLQGGYALLFFLIMVVYEASRGLQWHVLLRALDVRVPHAAEMFSFVLGEATKSAPIGNYFQNYLLSRVEGEDFGRTSATTTLIVLTEVGWALLGVAIIGVDGWTWVRPLILIGLPAFAVAAWLFSRAHRAARLPTWIRSHVALRTALEEFGRFQRGIATLMRPRPLLLETLFSGSYLLVAGTGLYVLAIGLGLPRLPYWQIVSVYLFSLAAGLILPLPVDLGVVEVSGVGALVATGLTREQAISLMLVNRLLTVGSAVAIAGISMFFLHDELRQALSERNSQPVPRSVDAAHTGASG